MGANLDGVTGLPLADQSDSIYGPAFSEWAKTGGGLFMNFTLGSGAGGNGTFGLCPPSAESGADRVTVLLFVPDLPREIRAMVGVGVAQHPRGVGLPEEGTQEIPEFGEGRALGHQKAPFSLLVAREADPYTWMKSSRGFQSAVRSARGDELTFPSPR